MEVRFQDGVRVGALTFDPTRPPARGAGAAFFTHRPPRRIARAQPMMSAPMAARWPGALGVPFHHAVVAMGLRLEVLPSGYGVGGAAVVVTRAGHRTLVVGPVSEAFEAQPADTLVLFAPEAVRWTDADWVGAACLGQPLTTAVPDAAAAGIVSSRLAAAGVPHRCPAVASADGREGTRAARVSVVIGGVGLEVDARPQLDDDALVALAARVGAAHLLVHGPRADVLAQRLSEAGLPSRVLASPRQLMMPGLAPLSGR